MIPIDDQAMPLVEVSDGDHEAFVEELRERSAVESVITIEGSDDRAVYAVEWRDSPNHFFTAVRDQDAQILSAIRSEDVWEFEIRFPSREALTGFREEIDDTELKPEVVRVIQSDRSTADPEEGLSKPQREALQLAVSRGYYSIPRKTTTSELADELGISDQAVVERLRRAMVQLAEERL